MDAFTCTRDDENGNALTSDLTADVVCADEPVPGEGHSTIFSRHPTHKAPEITRRLNAFEEVHHGSSVTFECHFEGSPKPDVRWFKDDIQLFNADRWTIDESEEGVSRLTIDQIQWQDQGAYKCRVENEEGVATSTGYLFLTSEEREYESFSPSSFSEEADLNDWYPINQLTPDEDDAGYMSTSNTVTSRDISTSPVSSYDNGLATADLDMEHRYSRPEASTITIITQGSAYTPLFHHSISGDIVEPNTSSRHTPEHELPPSAEECCSQMVRDITDSVTPIRKTDKSSQSREQEALCAEQIFGKETADTTFGTDSVLPFQRTLNPEETPTLVLRLIRYCREILEYVTAVTPYQKYSKDIESHHGQNVSCGDVIDWFTDTRHLMYVILALFFAIFGAAYQTSPISLVIIVSLISLICFHFNR